MYDVFHLISSTAKCKEISKPRTEYRSYAFSTVLYTKEKDLPLPCLVPGALLNKGMMN
jgi:hypothetical protein